MKEGEKPPQMYFRQAQVAPTLLPEFQGNVVAVPTAPFWDDELGALQQRMEEFNAKMDHEFKKDPSLSEAARDQAYQKAKAENFTPQELKRSVPGGFVLRVVFDAVPDGLQALLGRVPGVTEVNASPAGGLA